MYRKSDKGGMTLIEIIIVMAILIMIFSFGLIYSFDAYRNYIFRSEVSNIVSVLENARSHAMSNEFQTSHGVCFIEPNYVVFRGNSCVTNPTNENVEASESIANSSNFSVLFPVVVFTQLSGTTSAVTINVTDGVRLSTIKINDEGTIEW